jgi:hypothetical protein
LTSITQGANQPMMRFGVRFISLMSCGDGLPKGQSRLSGRASGKQIEALLGKRFGGLRFGCCHDCY